MLCSVAGTTTLDRECQSRCLARTADAILSVVRETTRIYICIIEMNIQHTLPYTIMALMKSIKLRRSYFPKYDGLKEIEI